MPGVEPVDGWLDVSKIDNGDEMVPLLTLLGQELGAEVEGWATERVREVLRSDHYFHAIHFPKAFHIHPLNYALGLAGAAEDAGARIFEETQALEIDPAGVRKRVVTPSGRVRANHIVLAGNTGLGALAPDLAQTVVPVSTFVGVTTPIGEQLAEAITYRGAVSDSRSADHHYRIVGGDRLMWAGGVSTWSSDPGRHVRSLRRSIAHTYPQLQGIEIAEAWSGTMGFSVHRMPQIGEVSPGLWIASAFAGHGLNTSAMAGALIARAIVEQDDTWRVFLPYDLVWAGGALGRSVMQVGYWSQRWGESMRARAARRRQASRRREEAAETAETIVAARANTARRPGQGGRQRI
jgi:glycine/D-amino acid oxidase-like deaminating enzyme